MGLHGIDKPDTSARKIAIGIILLVILVIIGGWLAYKKSFPSQQAPINNATS